MSSPPLSSENTALATPVSPASPAGAGTPSRVVSSAAASPAAGVADAAAAATAGVGADPGAGVGVMVPRPVRPAPGASETPLPALPLSAPGPHEVPDPGVPFPAAPATQAPCISTLRTLPPTAPGTNHVDQNKYSRPPTLPQRSHGPSLLTQALATVRGIPPPPGQTELSHDKRTHQHGHAPPATPPDDKNGDYSRFDLGHDRAIGTSAYQAHDENALCRSDGDPLTQKSSPRVRATAPFLTAVPTLPPTIPGVADDMTTATVTSPHIVMDFQDVKSILKEHRAHLSKGTGRDTLLESTAKERRAQDRPPRPGPPSQGLEINPVLVPPRFHDVPSVTAAATAVPVQLVNGDENPPAEEGSQMRFGEQRLSMGPEKAWSIGTGELSNAQDGQVEKSISEVLAGVEPNTRSRKASHSLRFFREGLPDETTKRRDSRHGQHPREKLLSAGETWADVRHNDIEDASITPTELEDAAYKIGRLPRARSFPIHLPDVSAISESPEDYFKHGDERKTAQAGRVQPPQDDVAVVGSTLPNHDRKEASAAVSDHGRHKKMRRKCDDGTEAGEDIEDGDESGEEKISSAVFLPHQGLEPPQKLPTMPLASPRSGPGSRTLSRNEDYHSWLVKADEPEADDHELEGVAVNRPSTSAIDSEVSLVQAEESAVVDDSDVDAYASAKPSHPVSQYEDHVHEHQLAPKQPLEAIELIPYNHQVGGHTTLWRFSRRAVCKQLNNRENEFYEKVEKYHRDLLAFLPRYIGVLNVTFQKQPRRKSTVKRDDAAALERKQADQNEFKAGLKANGSPDQEEGSFQKLPEAGQASNGYHRVISQSLQSTAVPVPTVTFVDNQHILPRNLLQPPLKGSTLAGRYRSTSASVFGTQTNGHGRSDSVPESANPSLRPSLEDRHANSWGATTVNKKLRNEVFNDAFLKQPITIHRHRKAHQRTLPRRALQQSLRPASSDPSTLKSYEASEQAVDVSSVQEDSDKGTYRLLETQSDLSPLSRVQSLADEDLGGPRDVTGTSAPEPEIIAEASPAHKKKRRYSGSALRRKPRDVREPRGDLRYFEEADDAGYKGDIEEATTPALENGSLSRRGTNSSSTNGSVVHHNGGRHHFGFSTFRPTGISEPPPEDELKIPRPINPKEAQTQRDSRVEYFLLLEDLTAGMKRPCIMDLKMGTRQYGVDASPKKQKSQQGKCAKTTSRELGVRVCGLQVWDVKTQSYVFKDKYFGRNLKAGQEFQDALTRFLHNGVEPASILRHIPTVLQKLAQLEVIIRRLRGYRFYAASLLMFYDGDDEPGPEQQQQQYDTAVEDSTTDFATDTEEAPAVGSRRAPRNKRQIDFKMADFANCVTAPSTPTQAQTQESKPCPPRHPDEPDRGFLRGLRSLRRYFLKIQHDTRLQMGLPTQLRGAGSEQDFDDMGDEEEGSVSE